MLLIYKYFIFNAFHLQCFKSLLFNVNKKTWKRKSEIYLSTTNLPFWVYCTCYSLLKKNAVVIKIHEHFSYVARDHAGLSDLHAEYTLFCYHCVMIQVKRFAGKRLHNTHHTLSYGWIEKHQKLRIEAWHVGAKRKGENKRDKKNNANK